MARDILIEFKNKKTWKKTFKDRGKRLPIELDSWELFTICGGLLHLKNYLEKEKRFQDVKEVEKLYNEFSEFSSMASHLG